MQKTLPAHWVKNLISIAVPIVLALVPMGATAMEAEAIRFGPEFTFTSPWLANETDVEALEQAQQRLLQHMHQHLVDNQPDGAKFTHDHTQFISPNGWGFKVEFDPSVIEVTMNPMTVAEWKRFSADIQDAVFASAANVGFVPWDFLGGGHINIDSSIFRENPLLARNFLVDFWNHNELSMGVFGYDTNNAVPLSLIAPADREKILEILNRFDPSLNNESLAENQWHVDENLYANILQQLVTHNTEAQILWGRENVIERFVDMSLAYARGGRLEMRVVRPQKSVDMWTRQIELLMARIRYLKTLTEPLLIASRVPLVSPLVLSNKPDSHLYNPPVDPQLALQAFYEYVTETGLAWTDHRDYLWPQWITNGELEIFEHGEYFKSKQQPQTAPQSRACSTVLESLELN